MENGERLQIGGPGADGKQVRQSLKTTDWAKATAMLKERATAGATMPATEPQAGGPDLIIHVWVVC